MDIFAFHKDVIAEYADYVSSFIDIRDERIRRHVEDELASGRLWPDPLVQFNPAYKDVGSIDEVCDAGLLHDGLRHAFSGYRLYEHQLQALTLGAGGTDFVVTSGTGSGKSVAFLGTIFDHVLRSGAEKGIRAIIIYPMNALINSQSEEIYKYAARYLEKTGAPFPVQFAQYTGQEGDEERQRIIEDQPHILLTNYMMMELIMTRRREEKLRASIREHLRFLVYDELHTYRGRQGSDVGMLNRRIHEFAHHPLLCIGTSATMASGTGTLAEQRAQVADVARRIFAKPFTAEQIIGESLTTQFQPANGPDPTKTLGQSIDQPIDPEADESALSRHPLALWLEQTIGLEEKEDILVRRKPMGRNVITGLLAEAAGRDERACSEALGGLLKWVETVNLRRAMANLKPFLPFKLHQFIAQTGSVFVTLEDQPTRRITLDAGYYVHDESSERGKPIFPVAFSRISGHDFICVRRNEKDGTLTPRDLNELPGSDDEDDESGRSGSGYLLLDIDDTPLWDDQLDLENLPDAWLNRARDGRITSVKRDHRHKLPRRIFFDADGAFSEDPTAGLPFTGWFVPAKLTVDPTSGIVYDTRTAEYTKLARLGSEARSTSTSVLSRTVALELSASGAPRATSKLLSFTDNRQDASLQAGHFNDFNQVVQLRSAIYHAVADAPDGHLDDTTIAQAVFRHLALDEPEYARTPIAAKGFKLGTNDNDEALKRLLFYRALYDLRRSWRVVLPNLEQCALLRIGYRDLDAVAGQDEGWKNTPGFNHMAPEDRRRILHLILDYFRTSFALRHETLTAESLEKNRILITDRLRPPWTLDRNERLPESVHMRLKPFESRFLPTASIGFRSKLGQYFRKEVLLASFLVDEQVYIEWMGGLLDLLTGIFFDVEDRKSGNETVRLYRLLAGKILWLPGDRRTTTRDVVRLRTFKTLPPVRPNKYFQTVYGQDPSAFGSLHGAEHTGQISHEDRQDREQAFREGRINALFCSPTMELGIDIADLNVVHMRNAPPNPANYAQRSGRAGRSGQAALVLTYCANASPHDRHYFNHSTDLVAGIVAPPRIDLSNRELLQTHLNALYLSEAGLESLDVSIASLIDLTKPSQLPLRDDVTATLHLGSARRASVRKRFERVLERLDGEIKGSWFSDKWIDRVIDEAPLGFNRAINRWRVLYQAALRQRADAQRIIDDPHYKSTSEEKRRAEREEKQARRQLALLRNEVKGSRNQSEFYPYRYLAAEGFLPGYNFPSLPVRALIPVGDDVEFVSRPRRIAISEFGPRNLIYHNGAKFDVGRQLVVDIDEKLEQAKVSKASGYFLRGEHYTLTNCPITGLPLTGEGAALHLQNLLELSEVQTFPRENITCEEEERSREGYLVETYFALDGPLEDVEILDLKVDEEVLLTLKYIPTARLYYVNRGWRYYADKGFAIETKTGKWRRSPKVEMAPGEEFTNPQKTVELFTHDVADAVYLHPSAALGLDYAGVVTLQYALEKGVGAVFQVEANEIGSTLMGEREAPNVMLYEASEGSLGVLSQLTEKPERFREVVRAAYDICHFSEPEDQERVRPPASYDDLLSYRNQRFHAVIDRRLIRDALEMLMVCQPMIRPGSGLSYEEQYAVLVAQADPSSTLELKLLKLLYDRRLRLPDKAQYKTPDLYVQPDFFYKPNVVVFVDGSVHDDPALRESDRKKRLALTASGYRVISFYYKDNWDGIVEKNGDVFSKVMG